MDWPVRPPPRAFDLAAARAALVSVLAPTGRLSGPRAAFVAALEEWLGSPDAGPPPGDAGPAATAAAIVDPTARRHLIDAMVVGLLVDGHATEADADALARYAAALGVEADFGIGAVRLFAQRRRMRLRFHVMRRFWPIERIIASARERGWLRRLVPFVLAAVFGVWRHGPTRDRYAALRDLPEGTLGRELVDYFAANGFPLYGEPGAIDELIVFHDYSHVLAGYGTFPAHEILTAWFMAGYRGVDLPLMLFPLIQFHLGVLLNPVAPATEGLFDPRTALEALLRGYATTTDLTRDWDFWPEVALPLDEIKRRYNVLPSQLLPADTHLHPERKDAA